MSNEILEKINYLKLGVDNVKTKEAGWLPVPLSHLVPLLNELERINSLEPVGYMRLEGGNNIKEYGFTHIYEEKFDKETIPLYRLDK